MGRPINDKYTGDPAAVGRAFPAVIMSKAWLPGQIANATTPVFIVKQKGTGRYLVSDGTNQGLVTLMPADPTGAGQASMYVTPFVSAPQSGAVFTPGFKIGNASVANGGINYVVGNILTTANGTVRVASLVGAAGTAIATVDTINATSTISTIGPTETTAVTTTGGAGSGATLNFGFILFSLAVSGGTGYTTGESIVFNGIVAGTSPIATLNTVTSGVPSTTTFTAGANITVSPTSLTVASVAQPFVFAKVLKNRTVKTWDGLTYSWDPYAATSKVGQANIPHNASTGTEALTYHAADQNANAGGNPGFYQGINSGPSPKTTQMLATAGVPGGSGSSSQATSNVGGATGIFNPSSTMRKAPLFKSTPAKRPMVKPVRK